MSETKIYNTFKKNKIILLVIFIIAVFIGNGCDYLFRGEYPDTYPNTIWTSNDPDWIMTVDSNNVMISIMTIDKEQLEFAIKFRGHCMDVYIRNTSECLFSGHGIFNEDKFIIDEIIEDELFGFRYEKITFIRSDE